MPCLSYQHGVLEELFHCGVIVVVVCRCKFGQLGPGKGQFNSPHGFCLGMDEDIVVADTNNHRIQVFEKSGDFKYQFGIPGEHWILFTCLDIQLLMSLFAC